MGIVGVGPLKDDERRQKSAQLTIALREAIIKFNAGGEDEPQKDSDTGHLPGKRRREVDRGVAGPLLLPTP